MKLYSFSADKEDKGEWNEMKKKIMAVLLAATMLTTLGACGASDDSTYKVGICQLVQHDALDAATQGFKDALIEELGEENVKFDEQNAQGD